ncbi:hypothetical protein KEJ45_06345 [Candidatus Bathyarchaeota archaeon]|nr:hypothetical protein [Candidatus Bathyarchaeota archaeon]
MDKEREKHLTPFLSIAGLLEKTGEVASTVKNLEGFKPLEKIETKETLAASLSEVLYTVFVLAEYYGINLEESFMQAMNDYMLKFGKL